MRSNRYRCKSSCRLLQEHFRNSVAFLIHGLHCSRNKDAHGPAPVIQCNRGRIWRDIYAHNRWRPNQQARLVDSRKRLQSHCCENQIRPCKLTAKIDLCGRHDIRIVATANAEKINLITADIEANHRLDYRQHGGIIGPYAAIDERIASMLKRPEKRRGWRGRKTNPYHLLKPVALV